MAPTPTRSLHSRKASDATVVVGIGSGGSDSPASGTATKLAAGLNKRASMTAKKRQSLNATSAVAASSPKAGAGAAAAGSTPAKAGNGVNGNNNSTSTSTLMSPSASNESAASTSSSSGGDQSMMSAAADSPRRVASSANVSDMDSVLDGYGGYGGGGNSTSGNVSLSGASDHTPEDLVRLSWDQLVALIGRERGEKEEIEGRLATVSTDHAILAQTHAEFERNHAMSDSKLQAAYDTAARLEAELANQSESAESVSLKLRDAEREGREASKRWNEQTTAFEAERAAWQDREGSLNRRLVRLQQDYDAAQAKATTATTDDQAILTPPLSSQDSSAASPAPGSAPPQALQSPTFAIPASTLEELDTLHERIREMTREHDNVVTQAARLHAEIEELQRFNGDLQEQNENYEALLSERMLYGIGAGQHVLDTLSVGSSSSASASASTDTRLKRLSGSSSRPSSALSKLDENDEDDTITEDGDLASELLEGAGSGSLSNGAVGVRNSVIRTPRQSSRYTHNQHRRTASAGSIGGGGGGGLNLEAELGRAERDEEDKLAEEKEKRRKDAIAARRKANQSHHLGGREGDPIPDDLDTLRKEVRLLRQENKGLTTYVSKILERVIGLEGFEKVLAVDKDFKATSPLSIAGTAPAEFTNPAIATPAKPPGWQRPSFSATTSTTSVKLPVNSSAGTPISPVQSNSMLQPPAQVDKKKNRVSMDWMPSFWRSTSGSASSASTGPVVPNPLQQSTSGSTNPPPPGFKPMMLASASRPAEDEEDQITRARLQSEMRLLGLDNAGSPVLHTSTSVGGTPVMMGSSRFSTGASPSQRLSTGTGFAGMGIGMGSPAGPPLPAKDDGSGTPSGTPSGGAPETIKLRGHRKRPSASNRENAMGIAAAGAGVGASAPSSVGLGFSYSSSSSTGAHASMEATGRRPSVTSASSGGGDSGRDRPNSVSSASPSVASQ